MSNSLHINGREIGPATDLVDLLRKQFKSGTALGQGPDEGNQTAVYALFQASAGTSLEKPVADAIATLLTDPDPKVRSGAVDTVQQFPRRFDPGELLRILDTSPSKFESPADPPDKPGLRAGILRAVAAIPTQNTQVIRRLRQAALDPEVGPWLLAGVATNDPEWVIKHISELVDGNVDRARILIFRLKDAALRERLIRSVPRESPQLRRLFSEAVSSEVKDGSERNRLSKLLGT